MTGQLRMRIEAKIKDLQKKIDDGYIKSNRWKDFGGYDYLHKLEEQIELLQKLLVPEE